MYLLIGINPYSFEDSKTGELVQGNNVHVICDTPDSKNFVGRETVKFNLSDAKLKEFLQGRTFDDVLDTEVSVMYNKFGKVGTLSSVG